VSEVVSLVLLGKVSKVEASELPSARSPFTGNPVQRMGTSLVVDGGAEHERLMRELGAAADGSAPIEGAEGSRWRITSQEYTRQSWHSVPRYVHNVELEECEELVLDRVEFGGLSIAPDVSSWEIGPQGQVMLTVMLTLDPHQNEQFERFYGQRFNALDAMYFPVSWVGVSREPVSMRFGRCLWESALDGSTRHLVRFAGENESGNEEGGDFASSLYETLNEMVEPQLSRLQEQAASLRGMVGVLLGELERAGTLDQEAVGRIKDAADNLDTAHIREFDRVNGLEKFM
jgi:hypothetical protein